MELGDSNAAGCDTPPLYKFNSKSNRKPQPLHNLREAKKNRELAALREANAQRAQSPSPLSMAGGSFQLPVGGRSVPRSIAGGSMKFAPGSANVTSPRGSPRGPQPSAVPRTVPVQQLSPQLVVPPPTQAPISRNFLQSESFAPSQSEMKVQPASQVRQRRTSDAVPGSSDGYVQQLSATLPRESQPSVISQVPPHVRVQQSVMPPASGGIFLQHYPSVVVRQPQSTLVQTSFAGKSAFQPVAHTTFTLQTQVMPTSVMTHQQTLWAPSMVISQSPYQSQPFTAAPLQVRNDPNPNRDVGDNLAKPIKEPVAAEDSLS